MPDDNTSRIMRSYLDALVARADIAGYFADDATLEIVGTPQAAHGPQAIQGLITWLHTQAFDAVPKLKTVITDDGRAALEADFVGTHTGEFLGMAPTGKSVNVPYCVVYDLTPNKISALRIYMPMELFAQQLGGDA
jgi:predicted ester cyclase